MISESARVALGISPWDASDYIKCQKDIDAFMEVMFADGDPGEMMDALKVVIKALERMKNANNENTQNESIYEKYIQNNNPTIYDSISTLDTLGYTLTVVPKKINYKIEEEKEEEHEDNHEDNHIKASQAERLTA